MNSELLPRRRPLRSARGSARKTQPHSIQVTLTFGRTVDTNSSPWGASISDQDEWVVRDCRPNPPRPSTSRTRRDTATHRSAAADVPPGHPPQFEYRGAGCHDRVLRGEVAQCLLVIGLDNCEAVRVVLSEDRPEHDHVATFEVRPPVGSMAIHDLPLRVGHSLSEARARSDEAQDEGGHAA